MPKQRAPISSRLRSRVVPEKEQYNPKTANETSFSPRYDNNIYLDELQSPLSYVRAPPEEREKVLRHESNRMIQSFGKLKARSSTFYQAHVAPPVQSKRMRHLRSESPVPSMRILPPSFIISKRHAKYKKTGQKRPRSPSMTPTPPSTPSPIIPSSPHSSSSVFLPPVSSPIPSKPVITPSLKPRQSSMTDQFSVKIDHNNNTVPPIPTSDCTSTAKQARTRPKYSRRKRELRLLRLDNNTVLPPPNTPRASRLRSNSPSTGRVSTAPAKSVKISSLKPQKKRARFSSPPLTSTKSKKKRSRGRTHSTIKKSPSLSSSSSTSSSDSDYTSDSSDASSIGTASFSSDSSDVDSDSSSSSDQSSSGVSDSDLPPVIRKKGAPSKMITFKKLMYSTKPNIPSMKKNLPTNNKKCSDSDRTNTTSQLPTMKKESASTVKNSVFTSFLSPTKKVAFTFPVNPEASIKQENDAVIPSSLSSKIPLNTDTDTRYKWEEYLRRQRRLFINCRYVTDGEAANVAMAVYTGQEIGPTNRLVGLLQKNFNKYRLKLRRIFDDLSRVMSIKRRDMEYDDATLKAYITNQMTDRILKSVWEYWLDEPYVDQDEFFENASSVSLLKDVTVQAIIYHYKEKYQLMSSEKATKGIRQLDAITRTLDLPEFEGDELDVL
ncbi:hypothetical protein G6F60_011994 [Rhizopus arrhizus]|nr:hypothetical protein G6F60_011994 [Rhizopus arrhizus]